MVELLLRALADGHTIKLTSILLKPVPTQAELDDEAALWEVANEIEQAR
jgi:hypothetical protein